MRDRTSCIPDPFLIFGQLQDRFGAKVFVFIAPGISSWSQQTHFGQGADRRCFEIKKNTGSMTIDPRG